MKNSRLQAKAQVIETNKNKILYAGAALLAGLMALVLISSTSKAETKVPTNSAITEELKSQKLSH